MAARLGRAGAEERAALVALLSELPGAARLAGDHDWGAGGLECPGGPGAPRVPPVLVGQVPGEPDLLAVAAGQIRLLGGPGLAGADHPRPGLSSPAAGHSPQAPPVLFTRGTVIRDDVAVSVVGVPQRLPAGPGRRGRG